jgi:hypothetical protein
MQSWRVAWVIYFIQGTVTKNIKIGHTNKTGKRFKERLQSIQSSDPLVVLRVVVDSDAELHYQTLFKHLWSHGEWFKADPELFAYIMNLPINEYTGMRQAVLSPWERSRGNAGRLKCIQRQGLS